MVLFNYSTKEITAKIVYYGPGLCGKTTNLQFIYDNLPQAINKGKMLSLATKTDRTLFFDFLPIDLGTIRGMRTRLQLYTVPGQVFYNTTRKLVLKGADGVVFVADSQRRMLDANLESFGNLEENLAEHDMKLADMPMILQFNKRDLPDVGSMEELNAAMNKYNAPIYEAVAPTGIGVHETLKAITRLVLNSLKERYADKREQKADSQARASMTVPAGAGGPRTVSAVTPAQPPVMAPLADVETIAPETSFLAQAQESPESPDLAHSFLTPEPEPLSFDLPELEDSIELEARIPNIEAPVMAPLPAEPEFGGESMNIEEPPVDTVIEEAVETAAEEDLLELLPAAEQVIEAGGEELLELADEPIAELVALEDSIAMPLLDVTSEINLQDEPSVPAIPEVQAEEAALAVSAEPAHPVDPDSPLPVMEEIDGSMDELESISDLSEDTMFEPIAEDHHDTSLPLAQFTDDFSAEESLFEPERVETFDPMLPSVPLSDLASPPAPGVRSIIPVASVASEINLPVKLEIGGRCITFELRISLDLAEATAVAASTGSEVQGGRQ